MGERVTGFTFPFGDKDVFVITDRERKTKYLCQLILRKLGKADRPGSIDELMYWLKPATHEINELGYHIVKGKGFTYCDPENKTLVIEV